MREINKLDYFQQIDAELKVDECRICCNLRYCIQGKLNRDWLRRVRKERNYEKVRVRKNKIV